MFPKVSIKNDLVSVDFSLIQQLVNCKPGGVRFLKSQVVSIETGAHVLKHLRGFRAPGTYAYFVIGGTYWTGWKKRSFWTARKKYAKNSIQVNLKDHKYQYVVFQVADPEILKTQLTN